MSDKVAAGQEFIFHFGTKGMKWGVRKEKPKLTGYDFGVETITRTTTNGDTLTLTKKPPGNLDKFMARVSPNRYVKSYNEGATLNIADKSGKKIGVAGFSMQKDDIYLSWVTVNKSERGKGYATEVLKSAEELGRASGKKRMLLEVPDVSPDARHIYEKLGFEVMKESGGDTGLTEMVYNFEERQ